MASSFGSTTLVFDTQTQSTHFKENGNELLPVKPCRIDTSILDALSEQDRQQILLSTCMSSQRNWALDNIQETNGFVVSLHFHRPVFIDRF